MTDKQSAAWRWFYRLRTDLKGADPEARAAARAELAKVEAELTRDEYLAMSEEAQSFGRTNVRTGQSRDKVHALFLSGLRKLVVYRHLNDIGDAE